MKDLPFFCILTQPACFSPAYADNKKGFYPKIPQLVNVLLGEISLAWRGSA